MRMSGEEHERLKKKDLLRERGWVDKKRREDWLLGDGKEIRRKEAWSMEYADKKKKTQGYNEYKSFMKLLIFNVSLK